MDKLSQEGSFATSHYATSSWTYPSLLSLATGLYPHRHGGVLPHQTNRRFYYDKNNIPHQPREEVSFLTDYLVQAGFETYSFNSVLTAGLAMKGRVENLVSKDLDADRVFSWVRKILNQSDKKKFIHLQLWDLHEPLEVLERDFRPFGDISYKDKEKMKRWRFMEGDNLDSEEFNTFRDNRILLYDTALRFVDEQIEKFVDHLRRINQLKDSLILITSDHGEEFWEHITTEKEWCKDPRGWYGIGHGHTLFEELIHIPLIIYPEKIDLENQLTSAIDITPTTLEILGLALRRSQFDGMSLLNKKSNRRIVYAEEIGYGDEVKIARQGNQKVYYLVTKDEFYVTNLIDDPREQSLLRSHGTSDLERQLKNFAESKVKKVNMTHDKTEKQIKKRLEKLGYL